MTVETYARKRAEFIEARGVPPDRVGDISLQSVWHSSVCAEHWGHPCDCDVELRFRWPPRADNYNCYPDQATAIAGKAAEAAASRDAHAAGRSVMDAIVAARAAVVGAAQ